MIIWLGLLSLAWFCDGASLFFWITAMTDPVPFFDVLGISTLSLLVSVAAQILPTGFVLREMTASSLLSNWIPISVGIILTLGYRVGMILVEIILSVLVYTALHSPGGKKPAA